MNKNREIRRGDIFIADLGNDGIGSEQHGKRPVLILQNDFGNFFSSIFGKGLSNTLCLK